MAQGRGGGRGTAQGTRGTHRVHTESHEKPGWTPQGVVQSASSKWFLGTNSKNNNTTHRKTQHNDMGTEVHGGLGTGDGTRGSVGYSKSPRYREDKDGPPHVVVPHRVGYRGWE